MQPAFFNDILSVDEALDNLDPRFEWFVGRFKSIMHHSEQYIELQKRGVKVMIHYPFAYLSDLYLEQQPQADIYALIEAEDGWLRDYDGNIVDYNCPAKLIDIRLRNVVKGVTKIRADFFQEHTNIPGFPFRPDAFFVDFVWDKINWKIHDPNNGEEIDAAWRRANDIALATLKFQFGKRGYHPLLYVNGWHKRRKADAMVHESFPFTKKEGDERSSWIALFGEFGMIDNNAHFPNYPPMLLPAGGDINLGTGIPRGRIVETAAFANTWCEDAIIVDNDGNIFDVLDVINS